MEGFVYLLCDSFPEFVSNYYYIIIVSLPTGSNFIQFAENQNKLEQQKVLKKKI